MIGCDYSATCIYLAQTGINPYGSVEVRNTAKVLIGEEGAERLNSFVILRKLLNSLEDKKIYIEKPLVNAKFMSPVTGMMMTRTATFVEIAAMLEGIQTEFIQVQTWRKIIYGKGNPPEAKQAAVNYVRDVLSYEVPSMGIRKLQPDHNYAEAVCIAVAGLRLQAVSITENGPSIDVGYAKFSLPEGRT